MRFKQYLAGTTGLDIVKLTELPTNHPTNPGQAYWAQLAYALRNVWPKREDHYAEGTPRRPKRRLSRAPLHRIGRRLTIPQWIWRDGRFE